MLTWTLRERLTDRRAQRSGGRVTVDDTLLIVQIWLRACSKRAAKDGSGVASEVLEKLATHLKNGDA